MTASKTPRTDAFALEVDSETNVVSPLDFTRQLELESADLQAKLARAQAALSRTKVWVTEAAGAGNKLASAMLRRHATAIREAQEAKDA